MVNLQQHINNRKIYQSDFNVSKAIPQWKSRKVLTFHTPPATIDSPLSFFHPQGLDLPEPFAQTHAYWQALSSQELPGTSPLHFLHLKITFPVKEGERSVIWEVAGFQRLCFSILGTLYQWSGTVFPKLFPSMWGIDKAQVTKRKCHTTQAVERSLF